jgi:DNA-binding transcriptional LysR family regulator
MLPAGVGGLHARISAGPCDIIAPHGAGRNGFRPIERAMNSGLSWDEFRLVKSIADARSLVGAAELLGVNHSTVFRRLAAVELSVGARLFERSRTGYEPTAAGEEMIALATTMADSIIEFERRVAGRDIKPTGELSVTTSEAIGQHFMPSIVAQFQILNPGVVIELILSNQTFSLSRRDADIAIRLTNDPPETLVGRRICAGRWGVYCRRDVAVALGSESIDSLAFVGFGGGFGSASGRRWIEANVRPERLAARANSLHCILEMALSGLGAALLPCFLGDRKPDLARIGDPLPELDAGLWMLTHSDLRRSARVRAFMDFAGAELAKHRRAIEGEETAL